MTNSDIEEGLIRKISEIKKCKPAIPQHYICELKLTPRWTVNADFQAQSLFSLLNF